jgi:hypothetical protein
MDTSIYSPFKLLKDSLSDYSNEGTSKKLQYLKECSLSVLNGSKTIIEYHNSLLFLLGYPDNELIHKHSAKEMQRLVETVKRKTSLNDQLTGSGIAGTTVQSAYSITLIGWLIETFPGRITLHSFDDTGIHPKEVLKHALPEIEFELVTDEKLNAMKWLEKAAGTKDRNKLLVWLIACFDGLAISDLIKDQLFESLKLFVEIVPADKVQDNFSKSFNKLSFIKHFYHTDGIIKRFNEAELINKKLPAPKKLSAEQRNEIIASARIALAILNRETDPVTYCTEENIQYYELERGLSIALFSMDPERRMPLESYIGFMMFKNGYPMSYGGAWLCGKRSLIGINIFEAFRGGESAIVFAQLLRCYHMAFGADYFEVEPYQFGKNNPEGIQSGAFWFYHRFGFRPVDPSLFRLAENEHTKILGTKGYRSPVEVLKQFTRSNLFVHLSSSKQTPINPTSISRYITNYVTSQFAGDRLAAYKWAVAELKINGIIKGRVEKTGPSKLALFLAMCIDTKVLSAANKKLVSELIKTKSASEFDYVLLLRKFDLEKNLRSEAKQFLS